MNTKEISKYLTLSVLLCLLPACSQFSDKAFNQVPENFMAQPSYTQTQGAYSEYGNPKNLRYYKSVLPAEKWREAEVLNYNYGFFAFPPLCGYRVLHYEDYQEQTNVNLYRDVIAEEDFDALIARKVGCDHCKLIRSFPRGMDDLELVEADATCYVWLYGDYAGKYYFLKAGNVVYTFSLFSPPDTYSKHENEFDHFVKTTINKYLVYSPRQQQVPTTGPAPSAKEKLSPYFTRRDLISFFAPNQNLTFK